MTNLDYRALEEKRARLGLVECVNRELLQPYPVLHEKPGDFVAHIKFTVLLMPNGSDRVTSHSLQELQTTKNVDDPEIKAWLALSVKSKKKGGGKKKKVVLQLSMAHLVRYAASSNRRHNIVACLNATHANSVPFCPMIQFLQRSRIHFAITETTHVYLNQIFDFWTNAVINTENNQRRILSTVLGHQIVVTENTIRQVLHFDDTHEMPTQFDNVFIAGALHRMGYSEIPTDQYRKQHLSRVWRYLADIIIVCLSPRKVGLDRMSYATLSLMLALVYNKPYNFSGYIFANMLDNINSGDDMWFMYPRFLQLILNSLNLGIPADPISQLYLQPMLPRVFRDCATHPIDQQQLPDRELFGHIVDVNYVPPPNDGFEDFVIPPEPVAEEYFVDVTVQEQLDEIDNVDHVDAGGDEDGCPTPADSEGDVPPPDTLAAIQILRAMSQGCVHVPRRSDKRPRTTDSDSDAEDCPLVRRRHGSRIEIGTAPQPQPAELQQFLAQMDQMHKRFADQSAIIESQAAQIKELTLQVAKVADLEAQVARFPALEYRLLQLESVTIVLGEEGPHVLETTVTPPPAHENVNNSDINEQLTLDYLVSSTAFPGQPAPLNIDYSQVDLDFLRNMLYNDDTVVNEEEVHDHDDNDSVDIEDETIYDEYGDPDEVYMGEEVEVTDEVKTEPSDTTTEVPTTSNDPGSFDIPSPSAASDTDTVKTCKLYKMGKRKLKGLIISWKYDVENKIVIMKRLDGLQCFITRFNHLSTLPYCELLRLAQMNIINPTNNELANEVQRILRKEVNSKQFFLFTPNLGTRRVYRNRINPATNKPWVKVIFKSPKTLRYNPLEKLPLDFLRRLQYWVYDGSTGEAEIVYIPDTEPEDIWYKNTIKFRIYDPLSLINLTKKDLEALHTRKIDCHPEFRSEAIRFQKVVSVCLAQGVHAGGKFPANWKI